MIFRYFTYSFRLLDAHFPRISIIFVLAKGMKEIALPVLGRQYNAQVLIAFKVEYINVCLLFSSLVYFFLFVQCCFSEVVF